MKRNKFEQRKYNEMRRSLCIEFKYSKKPSIHKILTEAKGMVEGDDEILSVVMKKIQQETNNGQIEKTVLVTINDILPYLKTQPFFKDIVIRIHYKKQNPNGEMAQAEYHPNGVEITPDKKMNIVSISAYMYGDYQRNIWTLSSEISHELLHAYEDYQRRVKTGKSIGDMTTKLNYDRNRYMINMATQQNNWVWQQLSYAYYYLNSAEINAHTNGLKQTLKAWKQRNGNDMTADDAMQCIEGNDIYQGYIQIGNSINYIISHLEEYKTLVEQWYQLVRQENLSAGKIMRRFKNLYDKTWKRLRKSLASFARYVFEDDGQQQQ